MIQVMSIYLLPLAIIIMFISTLLFVLAFLAVISITEMKNTITIGLVGLNYHKIDIW